MIHDVTARDMRVYASGRPTAPGFAGISKVVIAVGDLDTSAARYRKAFGLDEPAQSKDESLGARLATFEGTPVVLAAALQADNWLAARVRKYGDAPCAFVIRRAGSHPSGKIEWVRLKATQGRIGIE